MLFVSEYRIARENRDAAQQRFNEDRWTAT